MFGSRKITVSGSASILGFVEDGGNDYWRVWDRFLTLDGKKAYQIGNICGTCHFWFERLEGAGKTLDADAVVNALNNGLESLDAVPGELCHILPDGEYTVMLSRVSPLFVMPGDKNDYFAHEDVASWGVRGRLDGLPHYPRTAYYRTRTEKLGPEVALYEFLVPMMPPLHLGEAKVDAYRNDIRNGAMPTAVAISILDVKEAMLDAEGENVMSHWCLAHYLLDGHHKAHAAALEGAPLSLLAFLATGKGISNDDEQRKLLELLAGKPTL